MEKLMKKLSEKIGRSSSGKWQERNLPSITLIGKIRWKLNMTKLKLEIQIQKH